MQARPSIQLLLLLLLHPRAPSLVGLHAQTGCVSALLAAVNFAASIIRAVQIHMVLWKAAEVSVTSNQAVPCAAQHTTCMQHVHHTM